MVWQGNKETKLKTCLDGAFNGQGWCFRASLLTMVFFFHFFSFLFLFIFLNSTTALWLRSISVSLFCAVSH